jgi:hypothetical protein
MQTSIAELIEAENADDDCCRSLCRHLFLRKANDLTWTFIDSIVSEGFIDPIRVRMEDGIVYRLRNGNHRLVAAILLGMAEVPTVDTWQSDSGSGPSGWPYGDKRLCYHNDHNPNVYVMQDPLFAEIINSVADGLSECDFDVDEPYECCDTFCNECGAVNCCCWDCNCGECENPLTND